MVAVMVIGQVVADEIMTGQDDARTLDASIKDSRMRIGGKAFNIASACAKLGCKSYLVSAVGNDPWGTQIRRVLPRFGIDSLFMPHGSWGRSDPISTPIARLTEGRFGERQVRIDMDHRIARFYSMALDSAAASPLRFDAIIFTLEFSPHCLEQISELLRSRKTKEEALVVGNPAPRESGRVSTEVGELIRHADGLVPNRYEAEYLIGSAYQTRKSKLSVSQRLVEIYRLEWCITTRGGDGWTWSTNAEDVVEAVGRVDPKDKVGASDVFTAAATVGVLRGLSVGDAALVGGIAAKIAIAQEGGAERFPSTSQIVDAIGQESGIDSLRLQSIMRGFDAH